MPGAVVTSTVIVPASATIMAPMTSSDVTLRNTHEMERTTNIPATNEGNTVVIINTFSSVGDSSTIIGPGNTFSIRVTGSYESNTLVTIDTFSSTGHNSVVVSRPSSNFYIGIIATHGINNSVVITNTLNTTGNTSTILVNKPTNAPNRESSNSAPNIAAAVGGAVGAVVFIAVTIIIILVIIVVSRKRRKKNYQIGRTSNTGT